MPRMNLTEEEALHIERLRVKNAADLAFNDGVEEACQLIESFYKDKNGALSITAAEGCKLARAAKRPIKLLGWAK